MRPVRMIMHCLLSVGLSVTAVLLTPVRVLAQPNVIFVLSDDQGHWALNAQGDDDCQSLVTPHLARLAQGGMRFSNAVACSPVCSASRATWLTGRLPSHTGVQDYLRFEETHGEQAQSYIRGQPTLSQALADHGYRVGLCGKWHLGEDAQPQAGFSYWSTGPPYGPYRDPTFWKNGQPYQRRGFRTDLLGDDALEFIEQNRSHPFFLLLSFYAPHTPLKYQPEQYRVPYLDATFDCFPDLPVHPLHMRELNGRLNVTLANFSNRHSKLSYAALVTALDANLGRVLKKLDELQLREETLIVFASDHGYHSGHKGIWGKGNSTLPLNLYERSVRIPLIWSHPGRIPAGGTSAAQVSSYDFFPTLFDYLKLQPPADAHRVGRSYTRLLEEGQGAWGEAAFFEYAYVRGVRTRRWKYVERTSEWPSELFDLEQDPEENHNVIDDGRYQEPLADLRGRLHRFFSRAGAPPLSAWQTTTSQMLPEYK